MTDLLALSLCAAADHIRDGDVSAQALVETSLAATARLDPRIRAFVTVEPEAARDRARSLDAVPPHGPLHGVPLAHKDMFHRAGRPCGYGSPLRAEFVPEDTASVIARLEAAGQVQTGRLQMAEFAMGPCGNNAHFGRPRNPWDLQRITGGSSSGSGAAVAARLVFGALGSDTGGSIRLPAAMCGIFGLKPTQGRVPVTGAMPLSASLDCIGPLARSTRDIGRLLDVIAGQGGFEEAAMAEASGLRIGLPDRYYVEGLAPAVAEALDAARRVFEAEGIPCRSIAIPDQSAYAELATIVFTAEAATLHLESLREKGQAYGPQVRARLLQGFTVEAVHYLRALQLRALHLAAMETGPFAEIDALLVPAMRGLVPKAEEVEVGAGPAMAGTLGALADLTRPISWLGLPALVMPGGFDGNGMPIGLQLIGRAGGERRLLALASVFEARTDFARQSPLLVTAGSEMPA
jgi:aspartyl-tRNA(Asn)/glutamyl-tRNA(Gln) amidotransferase subunit A